MSDTKSVLESLAKEFNAVFPKRFSYELGAYSTDQHYEPIGLCLKVKEAQKEVLGVCVALSDKNYAKNELLFFNPNYEKRLVDVAKGFLSKQNIPIK